MNIFSIKISNPFSCTFSSSTCSLLFCCYQNYKFMVMSLLVKMRKMEKITNFLCEKRGNQIHISPHTHSNVNEMKTILLKDKEGSYNKKQSRL